MRSRVWATGLRLLRRAVGSRCHDRLSFGDRPPRPRAVDRGAAPAPRSTVSSVEEPGAGAPGPGEPRLEEGRRRRRTWRRYRQPFALLLPAVAGGLVILTSVQLQPIPAGFPQPPVGMEASRSRSGRGLPSVPHDPWNVHDQVRLHEVPKLLRRAFLQAEDQRFFQHRGRDWLARLHAAVENLQRHPGLLRPIQAEINPS